MFVLVAAALFLTQPPAGPHPVQGEIIRYYPDFREIVVAEFGGGERMYVLADDVKVTHKNNVVGVAKLAEFQNVAVTGRKVGDRWVASAIDILGEIYFQRAPPPPTDEPNKVLATLRLYFATDRGPASADTGWARLTTTLRWPALAGAITALLIVTSLLRGRAVLSWPMTLGLVVTTGLAAWCISDQQRTIGGALPPDQLFGNDRGAGLTLGTCTVSLPREHQLGRLESPSIFKFEFRYDPGKHVVLQSVDRMPADPFYADLSQAVMRCPRREIMVFIHGYNQTFAEAARRTAQLAYDLEFDGPALFFSWPSQGGLVQYTVDEANVEWATPDLREFLRDLAAKSGARSIQLIAHSMGNRALTGALRSLATEPGHKPALFREAVFAAPDIDATVFQRDLFPAIRSTARRFTLYASSNDNALAASKKVHGYARAGDSGELLVVMPGLDTVDASGIDTSLLGHSYYGESKSVITDLYHLIQRGEPPQKRVWLRPVDRRQLKYWLFQALNGDL